MAITDAARPPEMGSVASFAPSDNVLVVVVVVVVVVMAAYFLRNMSLLASVGPLAVRAQLVKPPTVTSPVLATDMAEAKVNPAHPSWTTYS